MAEGADQIISYIGRKYNYFMNVKMREGEFHGSEMARNVSRMGLEYLSEAIEQNKEMIKKEQLEL